ncbi:MAG: hypothetical protein FP814_07965 [Desulfobacterium sp.]|nr:hypothetical protein [Desulfobacterium sp.]
MQIKLKNKEYIMKKLFILLAVLALTFSSMAIASDFGQNDVRTSASGPNGPAPNSGDGIPDGSGNDSPFGPNK